MQLSLDFSKAVEIWKHKMPDGVVALDRSGAENECCGTPVVLWRVLPLFSLKDQC